MGNKWKGHQGHARSKKTREQETQWKMVLYTTWRDPSSYFGKTRGTVMVYLESSGHGGIRDRQSFVKAELFKRQPDGSFKLVETITELAP
jgi:hypothetical protein